MLKKVINYISLYQNIPEEKVTKDSHLVRDLGMSSLDMIQLICAAEEHFNVDFDENKLHDLLTVEKIALYLENNMSSGQQVI